MKNKKIDELLPLKSERSPVGWVEERNPTNPVSYGALDWMHLILGVGMGEKWRSRFLTHFFWFKLMWWLVNPHKSGHFQVFIGLLNGALIHRVGEWVKSQRCQAFDGMSSLRRYGMIWCVTHLLTHPTKSQGDRLLVGSWEKTSDRLESQMCDRFLVGLWERQKRSPWVPDVPDRRSRVNWFGDRDRANASYQ